LYEHAFTAPDEVSSRCNVLDALWCSLQQHPFLALTHKVPPEAEPLALTSPQKALSASRGLNGHNVPVLNGTSVVSVDSNETHIMNS
jgi:hypothetical protein